MTIRSRKQAAGENDLIIADIVFSGLCLVRVGQCERVAHKQRRGKSKEGLQRPRRASDIEVLLVDTVGKHHEGTDGEHRPGAHDHAAHIHHPCLTYYAEDDLGLHTRSDRWDGVLRPSPEGKEVVSVDLKYKRVEIIPPWPYKRKEWSKLLWCSGSEPLPNDPEEDDRLDWVLQSRQAGLECVERDRAIAIVTGLPDDQGKRSLPNGEWRTRTVHRNREVRSRRPIRWQVGSLQDCRAIARDVVLRLAIRSSRRRGGRREDRRSGLTLRISNRIGDPDPYDIVLMPGGDDRLRFSISNLPRVLSEPWDSHWGMFSNLGSGQIADVVQDDDLVCVSTGACENGLHFDCGGK